MSNLAKVLRYLGVGVLLVLTLIVFMWTTSIVVYGCGVNVNSIDLIRLEGVQ